MDQYIDPLAVADQVVGRAGIAGDRDRVSGVIDAIAEGRLYWTVVDEECRHLHAIMVVNDTFLNIVANHLDAFGGEMFVNIAADMDVECVGLL